MIADDSILRHLPKGLHRKQAFFLDGLRHAAEIADLAYSRLRVTLSVIAQQDYAQSDRSKLVTAAFLDAWSFVDAIDRFRVLWGLMPIPRAVPSVGDDSFMEVTKPIRALRNVADHIAQRADYVISKDGAALGILTWIAVLDVNHSKMVSCAIVPGTVQKGTFQLIVPSHRKISTPTDLIHLRAGEHSACLSDVLPHLEVQVRRLEIALSAEFSKKGVLHQAADTDILIIGDLEPAD